MRQYGLSSSLSRYTDDHAGPRLRRMGVFGLAGLPGLGNGSPHRMGAALTYADAMPCSRWSGSPGRMISIDLALPTLDPGLKNGPQTKENGSDARGKPAPAKAFQGSRKGANGVRTGILSSLDFHGTGLH
jgi:hypothetical protein